jgi:hypothetical protein
MIIEVILKYRPKDLTRGIRELLKDEDGTGPVKMLYEHPLIYGLFKGEYNPKKHHKLPSYIPARNFALALMDIVSPATAAARSGAVYATAIPPVPGAPSKSPPNPLQTALNTIQVPQFQPPLQEVKKALMPLVNAAGEDIGKVRKNIEDWFNNQQNKASLQEVKKALMSSVDAEGNDISKVRKNIEDWFKLQEVKKALIPLVDAAGDDISRARENIEDWFNSAMDRVTGWYKRRTQGILLVLGFFVTIALNVNTLTILDYLSRDNAARDVIVAQAQEYAKQTVSPDGNNTGKLDEALSKVQKLALPIGWSNIEFRWHEWRLIEPGEYWDLIFSHLAGWFLTAIALSMGATFWFDCLKKLVTIRSTVKPEEKNSKEESTQKERK